MHEQLHGLDHVYTNKAAREKPVIYNVPFTGCLLICKCSSLVGAAILSFPRPKGPARHTLYV